MENEKKRLRFEFRKSDKILLGVLLALSLATVALTVARKFGLELIIGAVYLYLPLLILATAVGWGLYALIRRIRKNGVRLAVTLGASLVGFLAVVLAFSFIGYMANINLPQSYATLASPGGRRLVVLRSYELPDDEHIARRQAARLEADPEAEADLVAADWGFSYAAYPRVLNIFYRSDADVEGEVHLGYATAATMMVEWPDGDTAHFYVQDPEPGDDGECTVNFK